MGMNMRKFKRHMMMMGLSHAKAMQETDNEAAEAMNMESQASTTMRKAKRHMMMGKKTNVKNMEAEQGMKTSKMNQKRQEGEYAWYPSYK